MVNNEIVLLLIFGQGFVLSSNLSVMIHLSNHNALPVPPHEVEVVLRKQVAGRLYLTVLQIFVIYKK